MTALARRRAIAARVGFGAAAIAVLVVVALAMAGSSILADSTAGRPATDELQPTVTRRLPFTSTAMIGVTDDEGRLTSMVVAALEPDGTGGNIVQLPVAADPSSGLAEFLTPIDALLSAGRSNEFLRALDQVTGLSFDVIEIADEQRFAELVRPLGDLEVALPADLSDGSTGDSWAAGVQRLTSADAGRVLAATEVDVPSWRYEAVRAAVWAAVADRVGAGIGSADPVAADSLLEVPESLDEFVERLFAGPVGFRVLRFDPVAADDAAVRLDPGLREAFGPESLPASVVVDRADRLLVFASIAPSRLGAPLDGPTVRIVNGWTDDSFGADLVDTVDLLTWVVEGIVFGRMNVVSVVTASYPGEFPTPEVTRGEFRDAELAARFAEGYTQPFGGLETEVVDAPVDGVDIEIVVGRALATSWRTLTGGGSATVGLGADPTGAVSDDE
ncbi:MAG: hypothetical protein RLZZ01_613 [Actinomycetota bacterium]